MNLKALIVAVALLASASARAENVALGVLEEVPGAYTGESSSIKVRALFMRTAQAWTAYKSHCSDPGCLSAATAEYPKEMAWFIGFHGRQLGQVTARAPGTFGFYGHVGLLDVVGGKPPVVGKPSYEYAGFSGGEVHRPLVASSKPNFKDPAVWKRANVTTELRKKAAALLRNLAPAICIEAESKQQPLVPFDYSPTALIIRAYRSQDGRMVLTANAEGAYYCDGGAGDGAFDAQAFGIDLRGKARLLGAGLSLVDAGDYDLDGKSELVFALSAYNRGGYVLLSDDFKEQARYDFGYH